MDDCWELPSGEELTVCRVGYPVLASPATMASPMLAHDVPGEEMSCDASEEDVMAR